jgi:hypothetical protein
VGIRCANHVTLCTHKSRHYFADSGGRSVGIVRLRTKATEFFSGVNMEAVQREMFIFIIIILQLGVHLMIVDLTLTQTRELD